MNMQKLFPVTTLPEGQRTVVELGGRKILILHFKGRFFAVDNACPHLRFPLKDGQVTEDCSLVCPFHHSAFDLETGDVKEWSPWPPGLGRVLGAISRHKVLPIFETRVEDGYLYVATTPRLPR